MISDAVFTVCCSSIGKWKSRNWHYDVHEWTSQHNGNFIYNIVPGFMLYAGAMPKIPLMRKT